MNDMQIFLFVTLAFSVGSLIGYLICDLRGSLSIKEQRNWQKGFNWAMCEYFSGTLCIQEIEYYTYSPDKNEFDYGAQDALRLIRELKLTSEDTRYDLEK